MAEAEAFDPWATAAADGTSSSVMKSSKKKDVWGTFRAGEAEPLSDSEATKPKPGLKLLSRRIGLVGKKKKGADGKKARKKLIEAKILHDLDVEESLWSTSLHRLGPPGRT